MVLVSIVAGVAITAAQWIFNPWAFSLGGRTHLMPCTLVRRASVGPGEYLLYVWFGPARPNPRGIGRRVPGVRGAGYLCTPRGERIPLRVDGSMPDATGADTNGKAMRLELQRRPWYASLAGNWDRRPRLQLQGRWENPDLVMNDGGSFAAAFGPDGRVYEGPLRSQPKGGAAIPVVFREVPWTVLAPACR